MNEAALLAGRSNKEIVEKIDFISAVERSIAVCFSVISSLVLLLFLIKVESDEYAVQLYCIQLQVISILVLNCAMRR